MSETEPNQLNRFLRYPLQILNSLITLVVLCISSSVAIAAIFVVIVGIATILMIIAVFGAMFLILLHLWGSVVGAQAGLGSLDTIRSIFKD